MLIVSPERRWSFHAEGSNHTERTVTRFPNPDAVAREAIAGSAVMLFIVNDVNQGNQHPLENAMTEQLDLRYRVATREDISRIGPLIEASVRGLSALEYSPSQMDQALGTWLGLDTQLITDGTYFVVEPAGRPGVLAACGGWSRRRTPFGSDHRPGRDDRLLDPKKEAAKIRAFFVHPEWARRGIGSRLLELCEAAARAEGFTRCEMGATLHEERPNL